MYALRATLVPSDQGDLMPSKEGGVGGAKGEEREDGEGGKLPPVEFKVRANGQSNQANRACRQTEQASKQQKQKQKTENRYKTRKGNPQNQKFKQK